MSAIGPKQTWPRAPHMSAFGGKADMAYCTAYVCFDPKRALRSEVRPFRGPRLNRYYASGGFGRAHEAAKFHCSYWRRGGDAACSSGTAERADSAHRRATAVRKGHPGVGPCRGVPPGTATIRLDRWSKSTNRVSLGDQRFAESGNGISGIVPRRYPRQHHSCSKL